MDRRSFIALGSSALLTGTASGSEDHCSAGRRTSDGAASPQARPNILMIMADQLRMDCVGAYGNKAIKTPNIDRIAKEGILFRNAYSLDSYMYAGKKRADDWHGTVEERHAWLCEHRNQPLPG